MCLYGIFETTIENDLCSKNPVAHTIQKIMGRKDIKMTTEIYVHDEVETLRKDMKLAGKNGTGVVRTKIQGKTA